MRKGDSFVKLQTLVKTLVIIALSAGILQGCKLKIIAPLSGSVISDSGLYICQPGETCIINTNSMLINEVFRTIPETGYFFEYWLKGDNYLCVDETEACATLVNSGITFDDTLIREILSGEASFTVQPKFKLNNGFQAPIKGIRADVDVNYDTVEYSLDGTTYDEVMAQIQSDANPLPIKSDTGKRPASEASSQISYRFVDLLFSGDTCIIYVAELQAQYRSVLPTARQYSSMTESDQVLWDRALDTWHDRTLARHAITRKAVSGVRSALEDSGVIECQNIRNQVEDDIQAILLQWNTDLANFDLNASLGEI